MNARCTSRSDTRYARERRDGLRGKQAQRAPAAAENFLSDSDRGAAFGSASEQDRDQLARAQRLRAVAAQSLPGPLGDGQLANCGSHISTLRCDVCVPWRVND